MTHKTHDLLVKTGTYTDRDGNEKGRYQNVGALMEGENGPFIIMHRTFNPAGAPFEEGRDTILISCFEPQQDQRTEDRGQRGTTTEERQQQRATHGQRPGGPGNRERY